MLSKLAQISTNRPKRVLLIAAIVSVVSLVDQQRPARTTRRSGIRQQEAPSPRRPSTQIADAAGL